MVPEINPVKCQPNLGEQDIIFHSSRGRSVLQLTFLNIILQLAVKLLLKEWQFSDGSHSLTSFSSSSGSIQRSLNGISNSFSSTGRKIYITVVKGKDLVVKDNKIGKSDPYVRLQYGKVWKILHVPLLHHNQSLSFLH